jgi:membrane fusion protein (multidrug efflux system)
MNKKTKWGIIALIGAGLVALAVHTFLPHENKELTEAPKKAAPSAKKRSLNVIAEVIKPTYISDGSNITGLLLPDEEVNLTFETSGKITSIYFAEGSYVKEGELLAKVNDAQLQAQLRKLRSAFVKLQALLRRLLSTICKTTSTTPQTAEYVL